MSIWFEVNLHESKIHFPFFFSYCVKKYSSFGVGEGLKQGRSGNRKQTYIFFWVLTCIQGLTKKVCSFTC